MMETLPVKYQPDMRYVPLEEYETQIYLGMGYDIYAMYQAALTKTVSGVKWLPVLESRWNMKLYADKDGIRDLQELFQGSPALKKIAFFALVNVKDIDATVDFDFIERGVYVTRKEKGQYTGFNVYYLTPGSGAFKRIAYVPREQAKNLRQIALKCARDYGRN